ncbi:MAG: hypothetical protein E4H01_16940, partial [Lysobacterales bacterium]
DTMRPSQNAMASDPGLDSAPLRGITLRLSSGLGYDDNVFRTESNTNSDFFWSVRPSVYFDAGLGKHELRFGYEGNFLRYFEFSNEDFSNHLVFADAELDLTRKLSLNLNGEVVWGHDPRGGIGTCLTCSTTPDTWRSYRTGAELVIGRAISRAQITPAIEFSGIRYTNNGQSIRDFDRQDYGLRGRWRVTPRLSAVAEGGYTIVNHLDASNDLDRTETGVLGGIAWEATAKTSGEILIGTLIQDFDDPAEGSSTNFNWDARVHWAPKPYSKVTLFTRRASREDASGGGGHFLADTFGGGWRHAFSERLVLNADIDYTLATYSTGRRDNYLGFQIGLTHNLTPWLDIGAQYRYLTRHSNIPGIDYDDNMLLLNLTVGLQHGL